MSVFYRHIFKPVLFKFSPDAIHDFITWIGRIFGNFAVGRWFLKILYGYHGPDISKTVDGIKYQTPIILSAGFDPDGLLINVLPSLSFGGEEIGSVTAHPTEGNPKPHFKRLIRNKSIVVYKGLRNAGVDALIARLRRVPKKFVLGISIARTNAPSASVDVEAGIRDYVESFKKLNEASAGDYYAINISCPNAFAGETFSDPKLLEKLLPRLREISCKKPVYIKMPINIPWEQFVELADIADENGIQGLIIGNVTKDYGDLEHPEDAPKEFRGGLSGTPTRIRSNQLISQTRARYGDRFTIIGVGGIMTPEDAMEKFAAGADLVQLITGMIFEGPGLIKKICQRYAIVKP